MVVRKIGCGHSENWVWPLGKLGVVVRKIGCGH